jgi:hypothetical protein
MSFHVISLSVILCVIILFRSTFNKVGREGPCQIRLPRPSATASQSGRRQKRGKKLVLLGLSYRSEKDTPSDELTQAKPSAQQLLACLAQLGWFLVAYRVPKHRQKIDLVVAGNSTCLKRPHYTAGGLDLIHCSQRCGWYSCSVRAGPRPFKRTGNISEKKYYRQFFTR